MIISRIEGTTRILGKSQSYLGLPIRDTSTDEGAAMVSAWEPTPKELELLNQGGKVHVTILGSIHPPILLTVQLENKP